MQDKDTRDSEPAAMPNGGAAVVNARSQSRPLPMGNITRPSATGRITHPHTPLSVWVSALVKTSEAQRAHLRAQLAAVGVGR